MCAGLIYQKYHCLCRHLLARACHHSTVATYVPIALQRRAVGRLFVGLGAAAGLLVVAVGSEGAREGSVALGAAVVGAIFVTWIGFTLERGGLEKRAAAARPAPFGAEVLPDSGLRPRRAVLVGVAMLVYVAVAVALLGLAVAVTIPAVAAGIGGGSMLAARWAERWERERGGRLVAVRPDGVRARTPDLFVVRPEAPATP
ncbi:MAG: hypothetical protein QOD86_328 [Miltoncostaeaceae bacterium]|jgi:hypothetical protein|nr:hypothetical protein [Miltoncostaeaceae bacterium]